MKTIVFGIGLCAALLALADMTIVQKAESSGDGKGRVMQTTVTTSVKGGKMKVGFGKNSESIVDLAANKAYTIDHARKQIQEQSLDDMKRSSRQMADALGANPVKTEARPTGKTTTINGFACREYEVTTTGAANMTQINWMSDSVDMKELALFQAYFKEMDQIFGKSMSADLKGMLIRSEARYSVGQGERISLIEVESISHDPISDSVFAIPKDYEVINVGTTAAPRN